MLPGNMIIVIICTLLRPHPPDSSPPPGNPLILPFSSLPLSVFLSPIRVSIREPAILALPFLLLSRSLFVSVPVPVPLPSSLVAPSSLILPDQTRFSLLLPRLRLFYEADSSSTLGELRGNEREQVRSNHSSTVVASLFIALLPYRVLLVSSVSLFSSFASFPSLFRGRLQNFTMRNAISAPRTFQPPSSHGFSFPVTAGFLFSSTDRFTFYFSTLLDLCPSPLSGRLFSSFFFNALSSSATRPYGNVSSTETIVLSSFLFSFFFFVTLLRAFFHHPRNFPRVTNIEKRL